jgi:hypothetical protein
VKSPKRKVHVSISEDATEGHYPWGAWDDVSNKGFNGVCTDRRNVAKSAREVLSEALDIPQHRIEVVVHR